MQKKQGEQGQQKKEEVGSVKGTTPLIIAFPILFFSILWLSQVTFFFFKNDIDSINNSNLFVWKRSVKESQQKH